MNTYNTDSKNQTCTCLDWKETRQEFKLNDPRRLCKHIVCKLNIDNLPTKLKYFKKSLEYYQKNQKGFTKDFEKVIYLSEVDCKIFYLKDDWINVYDKNGNKYGFIPYSSSANIENSI